MLSTWTVDIWSMYSQAHLDILGSNQTSKFHLSLPVMIQRSLVQFKYARKCPNISTCSTFLWSSFSSLGTIFAQIFCMPKSSVIIFQTVSFFLFSWLVIIVNGRPTIATFHLPYLIDVDPSPFSLKTSLIWIHDSPTHTLPWTSCANEKHVCATWCATDSFYFSNPTRNLKFIIVSFLHNAERQENEM